MMWLCDGVCGVVRWCGMVWCGGVVWRIVLRCVLCYGAVSVVLGCGVRWCSEYVLYFVWWWCPVGIECVLCCDVL